MRNLANIKTSMTNACTYCTAHTSIYGKGLGIGAEECAALDGDAYKTSPLFTDKEKAVIAWAEAMTRNTAQQDKAVLLRGGFSAWSPPCVNPVSARPPTRGCATWPTSRPR